MNEAKSEAPVLGEATKSPGVSPFLQGIDWLSFAITVFLTLTVYLFTLNPSIDLDFSGIFVTGGKYLGVSHVPGFPLWTLYSHVFIVLLPISNIAWRVNVASAVASALTCGIVALLASRCGGVMLGDFAKFRQIEPGEERRLRLVCGCVAGLSLGFDTMFWQHALSAMPWNFTLLLLAVTLGFFLRWQHAPEQTRWFHLACFAYGLTITNSQALFAATVGFGFLILFTKPTLARDIFAAATIFLTALLAAGRFGLISSLAFTPAQGCPVNDVQAGIAVGAFLLATLVAMFTRGLFHHWRTVMAGGLSFVLGLTPYLLVPVFSMTNPPMNWGYPRTVEGFFHVISRGQYEALYPADSVSRFMDCLSGYAGKTQSDFGMVYVCFAVVPFIFYRRFQKVHRNCLLGLLALLLSLSVFLVYLLNPSLDRGSLGLTSRFFPISHLVLSILTGCGLMLAGAFVSKFPSTASQPGPQQA